MKEKKNQNIHRSRKTGSTSSRSDGGGTRTSTRSSRRKDSTEETIRTSMSSSMTTTTTKTTATTMTTKEEKLNEIETKLRQRQKQQQRDEVITRYHYRHSLASSSEDSSDCDNSSDSSRDDINGINNNSNCYYEQEESWTHRRQQPTTTNNGGRKKKSSSSVGGSESHGGYDNIVGTNNMKTIGLFGCESNTGIEFLKLALDAGYRIKAYKLPNEKESLRSINPNHIDNSILTLYEGSYESYDEPTCVTVRQVVTDCTFVVCFTSDLCKHFHINNNNNINNGKNKCNSSNIMEKFVSKVLYPAMISESNNNNHNNKLQCFLYQASSLCIDGTTNTNTAATNGKQPILCNIVNKTSDILNKVNPNSTPSSSKINERVIDNNNVIKFISKIHSSHHHDDDENENEEDENDDIVGSQICKSKQQQQKPSFSFIVTRPGLRTKKGGIQIIPNFSSLSSSSSSKTTNNNSNSNSSSTATTSSNTTAKKITSTTASITSSISDGINSMISKNNKMILIKKKKKKKPLSASKSLPGPIPISYNDLAEFTLSSLQNKKLYNKYPYVVGY